MTERLHFHFSLSCIGGGNGNPLRYSCLENLKDWGAWWAAVYGVAQSRTRLKRLSSSSSSSILEKVTAESCFNIHSIFLSLYYSYYSFQSLTKLITDKLLWAHTCLGHLAPVISLCMHTKLLQLCLTLCNPMDYSPPGSSVHCILQERILE